MSFSGSEIMEEKVQLYGKSGRLLISRDGNFMMFVDIRRMPFQHLSLLFTVGSAVMLWLLQI